MSIAVVTLQTFYRGKHDLLTVYLGKFYRLDLGYVLKTIEFTLTATPKQWLGKNEIARLLANRRSWAKVLMTEPDIGHAVKEILCARIVYIFAFLYLER